MTQAAIVAAFGCVIIAPGQKRDHLTEAESDVIRYRQELDKRIDAFITAADRRFAIINGRPQPSTKKSGADEPDWGELPKGSHAELLDDVAGILDEAITNIDNVNQRDPKNALLSRALRKLSAAANGYLKELSALKSKTTDGDELAAIDRIADNAQEIIEAGKRLPASGPDEDQKKKKP